MTETRSRRSAQHPPSPTMAKARRFRCKGPCGKRKSGTSFPNKKHDVCKTCLASKSKRRGLFVAFHCY